MHLNFFDHTRLGPDPEPYGERFERIMESMLENQRASRETAGQSSHCPLELAFGRRRNCTGSTCIFYRVPRVRDDCAVRERPRRAGTASSPHGSWLGVKMPPWHRFRTTFGLFQYTSFRPRVRGASEHTKGSADK